MGKEDYSTENERWEIKNRKREGEQCYTLRKCKEIYEGANLQTAGALCKAVIRCFQHLCFHWKPCLDAMGPTKIQVMTHQ